MRATATPAPTRKGKGRLLESCAIAAGIVALAMGGPALAQVAGTGQVQTGTGLTGATISPPAPGIAPPNTTHVVTSGPQTIINWTPTDTATTGAPIDFLPAGNTLEFYGSGDYTVLNRFISGGGTPLSRQIALNGTVNGIVGTPGATSGNVQGGNIWFYNAGGILIGSAGVINVGSLVLTANDIDTTGGLLGSTGEIRFRGAAGSTAAIAIDQNATINASKTNAGSSYIAMVAPRIVQAGSVNVDGSAAYVAAEQADIRINNGLFDINVLVGAEGGTVITHSGTTTGPAHQQGDSDQSRIYMVAIAKNDAVTMLVSGRIGYQDASSAQIEPNGAVRLSAGFNVTNGELDSTPVNATAANITVNDTLFGSSVFARASGAFVGQPLNQVPPVGGTFVPPPGPGLFQIRGDGTFIGDASATLTIGAGQEAGATGDLVVRSGGANGTPGTATVNVSGGQLIAGGLLSISANGTADAVSGNSQGGTATLAITGGTVSALGLGVTANGAAAVGSAGTGGTGRGGTASISVSNANSLLTTGPIVVNATGSGGGTLFNPSGAPSAVDNGGDGVGGTATLTATNGGLVQSNDGISVRADGTGDTGLVRSGNGTGGTARVEVTGSNAYAEAPTTTISANGTGGGTSFFSGPVLASALGGNGTGGTAELAIDGDSSTQAILGDVGLSANGRGGNTDGVDNGRGGNATGGQVNVTANGGIGVEFNALTIDATAFSGGATSLDGVSAVSGNAQGGNVTIGATNGALLAIDGGIQIDATGFAASSESAGSGTGGNVTVSATVGGQITALNLFAIRASGGNAASGSPLFSAGTGTGGNVDLIADDGVISTGSFDIDATGLTSRTIGTAGAAQGGTIDLLSSNGGLIEADDPSGINSFFVSGLTGDSDGGAAATGGDLRMIADAGAITLANLTRAVASGVTGGDVNFGSGPTAIGRGGSVLIQLLPDATDSSRISFDILDAGANGSSVAPASDIPSLSSGSAGNGVGGSMTIDLQGGLLSASSIALQAPGSGGGVSANSGTGQGGTATYTQTGGVAQVDELNIEANGIGGTSATTPGTGTGGTATVNLLGGQWSGGNITVAADGLGATGLSANEPSAPPNAVATNGGTGQGGTATINIDGVDVTSDMLAAYARGTGGGGGDFFAFSTTGNAASGGDGRGGTANINIVSGTLATGVLIADAGGGGGDGGFVSSFSSGPTTGLGGSGGTGQGGTATINFSAPGPASGSVISTAAGVGGSGGAGSTGGAGADGTGGLAQVVVTNFDAGSLAVTINASATGGNGGFSDNDVGGQGGNATGGTARVQADGSAANIVIDQVNFITSGTGGTGGNASVPFFGSPPPPIGFTGGSGGNGTGGILDIVASGGAAVALGDGGNVALASLGTGGTGGNGAGNDGGPGLLGGDGGAGGTGTGGTVYLRADGGTISANGGAVTINVNGAAGTGGSPGGGAGGPGNAAIPATSTGGTAIIEALPTGPNAGGIDLGDTNITANGDNAGHIIFRTGGAIAMTSLSAEATGLAPPTNNDTDVAPAGIFFGVSGGSVSTTGAMTLTTDSSVGIHAQAGGMVSAGSDLTINAGDQIDIRHDARSGTAPTIQAGGNLFASAATSISGAPGSMIDAGGIMALTASDGVVGIDQTNADGSIFVSATGDVTGNFVAGGDVRLNSGANITASATANGGASDPNGAVAPGDVLADAAGDVTLTNSSAARILSVNAAQAVVVTDAAAGEDIFVQAGTTANLANLTAGYDIRVNASDTATFTGPAAAGRDISVETANGISGGALTAQENLSLSTGGAIDIASAAGGTVALSGGAGVTADSVTSQGTTNLSSGNGSVTIDALSSAGAIDASALSVDISGGALNFAFISAEAGNATVNATGNLTVTEANVAGRADFRSGGDQLAVGLLTANDVQLRASNGSMALTDVLATGNIDAAALGTIRIDGTIAGPTIGLMSGDIMIGSAARVGTPGTTTSLRIENGNADAPTYIGGTATSNPSGYHLDADEMTRIYGNSIAVFAPDVQDVGTTSVGSAAPPDVIIDSFTITGGPSSGSNIGANGSFTITTPGKARVIGNAQLTGLTPDNSFTIEAGDAIEVILGQGTIRLTDGSNPTGMLNLISDDVIVATSAAIADVANATTTGAINDRLAQNDGITIDDGALYAGGIRATVVGGFYVQNSGAGTDNAQRRGLTFGSQGLDVTTSGASRIVINGVQLGANGQITGFDTISRLTIAGGAAASANGFDRRSTFNGCLIVNTGACATVAFDTETMFPVQDVIEEEADADSDNDDGNNLPTPLITMRDLDPLTGEPLLDDPVTGAGNDDLWTPPSE
jgi:hypothetical protein